MRRPDTGGVSYRPVSVGAIVRAGSGLLVSLPVRIDEVVASHSDSHCGCGSANPPSCHCGEFLIRASRSPDGEAPNGAVRT
jgi:hypothetical protein